MKHKKCVNGCIDGAIFFILLNTILVSFITTCGDDVCSRIPFGIEKKSTTNLIMKGFRGLFENVLYLLFYHLLFRLCKESHLLSQNKYKWFYDCFSY